jgi:5-methyltetrahydropteroyltriglutamate--homocysteine methyltransferase
MLKLAGAVVLYCGFVALLYVAQRRLQYFPERRRTAPLVVGLPEAEEALVATADGERVIVWHVPPRDIPATSPGCVTMCAANKHYDSYEDYLWAVSDAMAEEYRAIVNAGFILQLDCPDIPMIAHTRGWHDGKKVYGVKGHAELHIEAINRP